MPKNWCNVLICKKHKKIASVLILLMQCLKVLALCAIILFIGFVCYIMKKYRKNVLTVKKSFFAPFYIYINESIKILP